MKARGSDSYGTLCIAVCLKVMSSENAASYCLYFDYVIMLLFRYRRRHCDELFSAKEQTLWPAVVLEVGTGNDSS